MLQRFFIVSPDNRADYEALRSALQGDPDVQVIYDRRVHEPVNGDRATWLSSGPLGDRRLPRPDVDEQMRIRGWAVVRLEPASHVEGLTFRRLTG